MDMPYVGILSQRAKHRPNPIGITAVKLIKVKANVLKVQGLDTIDGTPILDLKPYYPQYDTIAEARTPGGVDIIMSEYF
jgi:tRNA (Thr-GGU) A37 N-methylase